jgi:kynurenine formamidase
MSSDISNDMASVLGALAGARIIDLAQAYEPGMPQSPNHPVYQHSLVRRHGDVVRPDGGSAANDWIVTGIHVGTHIDALCHVSHDGVLYEAVDAAAVTTSKGFTKFGIESVPPFVGRGVVLNIAALRGVDVLEPGEAVTVSDLEAACERQSVRIQPGDALLIGTGWARHWGDRARYEGQNGGAPGPDTDAGEWIASKHVRITGGETIAFEQIMPGKGHATLPVHKRLLVDAGINIIETLNLTELLAANVNEFLFITIPLKLTGATGSPVRPLAVITGANNG